MIFIEKLQRSGILARTDCSDHRRSVRRWQRAALGRDQLWSHAAKSRAAAKRLGIITVDVLPMAGSVGSILVARAHHHWRLAVLAHIVAAALRCIRSSSAAVALGDEDTCARLRRFALLLVFLSGSA